MLFRLDELLRQLKLAAASIGNKELEENMNLAENKLKRDIFYNGSIYRSCQSFPFFVVMKIKDISLNCLTLNLVLIPHN
jgi:hypothetical protein